MKERSGRQIRCTQIGVRSLIIRLQPRSRLFKSARPVWLPYLFIPGGIVCRLSRSKIYSGWIAHGFRQRCQQCNWDFFNRNKSSERRQTDLRRIDDPVRRFNSTVPGHTRPDLTGEFSPLSFSHPPYRQSGPSEAPTLSGQKFSLRTREIVRSLNKPTRSFWRGADHHCIFHASPPQCFYSISRDTSHEDHSQTIHKNRNLGRGCSISSTLVPAQ